MCNSDPSKVDNLDASSTFKFSEEVLLRDETCIIIPRDENCIVYLRTSEMDAEEFRRFGKQMVDYVADYLENIRDRKPFPDVSPGYLKELIPDKAPDEAEQWPDVMKDIERVIMPGVR